MSSDACDIQRRCHGYDEWLPCPENVSDNDGTVSLFSENSTLGLYFPSILQPKHADGQRLCSFCVPAVRKLASRDVATDLSLSSIDRLRRWFVRFISKRLQSSL